MYGVFGPDRARKYRDEIAPVLILFVVTKLRCQDICGHKNKYEATIFSASINPEHKT